MSSQAVRGVFRSALQTAFPAVLYAETLAMRLDNETLPALWQTLEFIPATDAPVSLGSNACYRETGTARVWVAGATGAGDGAILTQCEAVRDTFRRYRDPVSGVRVQTVLPPANQPDSVARWLLFAVDILYSRDYKP